MNTASASYQNNTHGFDVLGARGSVLVLLAGAGAAKSHSGSLEHQNRFLCLQLLGNGEHPSPVVPVSRTRPQATAHLGSGAKPQELGASW